MKAKLNSDSTPFARGLMLGELIANGEAITTATIRKLTGVSRATAKRDLLAIETVLRTDVVFQGKQRSCVRRDGNRKPSLSAYLAAAK